MAQKWCTNCKRYVNAERKFSVPWLVVGWIFLVPGLFYTILILVRSRRCPICQTTGAQLLDPPTVVK